MASSRRLDRYVLRELAGPTLLGLLLYTFALLMNHFFLVAEKSLSKGLSAELTLRLFLVGIPRLLVLSIPMAMLLGSLIAIGRLSADHEWVALQAAGHGPARLLRPLLLHGLVGSLASLSIYAVVVPRTHYAFRNLRGQVLFSSNLAADLKPRVFYELPDDSVLFVEEISAGHARRLEGVLLIRPDPDQQTTHVVLARSGDLYPAPDGSAALIVDAYEGEARSYRADDPVSYRRSRFGRAEGYRIEAPAFVRALLEPPQKVVQDLSFPELWSEIGQARRALAAVPPAAASAGRGERVLAERRTAVALVEFHQRIALSLASLLFAFLALPLGIVNARSGKGAGFAMSLAVILAYRIIFVLARNQGLSGTLPAGLAPWVANGVIVVWAAIAYRRLRRGTAGQGAGWAAVGAALRSLRPRRPRRRAAAAEPEVVGGVATLGGTSTRFIGRLDRYVGGAYLRAVGFAVASAYVIYGLVELQGLMDGILRGDQRLILVAAYFQYFLPTVLPVVLPIACLVGAVVAVTLLTRSGELVAIKSSGIGAQRTVVPLLLLTLGLCGLLFLVEDRIAPGAQRKAQSIKDQILGHAPRTHGASINGRWTFGPDGTRLYHYRLYDPARREFQGLTVLTVDREARTIGDHRFAERARWKADRWEAYGGWRRQFAPERLERFSGAQPLALDAPDAFLSQEQRLTAAPGDLPDQLSLSQLSEQIRNLRNSGYDITRLRVAYHGKFAHAAAPLVMLVLGLPFAFRVGRRGSLHGVGVALLLVVVYWATFAIFNALGLETLLPPIVAAWAPNALFGLLGCYLMLYVRT